jgi:hypothetical protein
MESTVVKKQHLGWLVGVCLGVAATAPLPAIAADPPPSVSSDGLQLQPQKSKHRLVYLKPGATFNQYQRVAILDCFVEFEKDWQKDYNRSRVGLDYKVSDADVERMKKGLAETFKKVFIDELQNKGGYQVVDKAAPDVLVLRPALVNVEVNAPDLMTPGINATVVRSAGQMTLFLELWDSTSNTILARVMDAAADENQLAQRANRVTNTQAAESIMRDWARELRGRLDEVRGKGSN